MNELIISLCDARLTVADFKSAIGYAQADLEKTREWEVLQALKAQLAEAQVKESVADDAVRQAGIEAYYNGGAKDKHPHPAITVKISNDVDVDEAAALPWLRENAKTYVVESIAMKPFTKAVQLGLLPNGIPGVVVSVMATIAIASDLTPWLPPDDGPEPIKPGEGAETQ